MAAILMDTEWYLIVVLNWIFPIFNDYLFIWLMSIFSYGHMFSLEMCAYSGPLSILLFTLLLLSYRNSSCILDISPLLVTRFETQKFSSWWCPICLFFFFLWIGIDAILGSQKHIQYQGIPLRKLRFETKLRFKCKSNF